MLYNKLFESDMEKLGKDALAVKSSFYQQYMHAVHWAVLMLLGNDSRPKTDNQFILCIVMLVFGILVFSIIIGSLSSMLTTLDAQANAKNEQLDNINKFLSNRKVDKDLCLRIRNYYTYL